MADLTDLIPEKTIKSPAFGIVLAFVAVGALILGALALYNQYETARLTKLRIEMAKRALATN